MGFSGNEIEDIEIIEDEPLNIDDTMEMAVVDGRMVRIECFVRETYIGKAVSYVCATDEDDGISTIGIENDEYDWLVLKENEIKSIEILDNDSEEDEDGGI